MAKSELYKPVPSVYINGFTHAEIQGHPAEIKNDPFLKGHVRLFSCVGIETPPSSNGFQPESNLVKISAHHGRSYEFRKGEDTTIIWADEYGNIYTKLNTKGNNCTHPQVFASGIAPSGFMLYGMQDSDAIVRCLKASELLRSHNVDTEAFLRVIEPAELPWEGENLPISEFKRKLVQQIWDEDSIDEETDITGFRMLTRKQLPKLSAALNNMIFLITVRGLQVSERLADFEKAESEEERLQMLSNAFLFVNIDEEIKARKDKDYKAEHFSIEAQEDIEKYFVEYLPRRFASNLATMHKLGLIHFYPHSANVSTVGSFYDLDSVRGKPLGLGDKPITHQDIMQELQSFLDGNNNFSNPSQIAALFIKDDSNRFRDNFIKHYAEEMGWVGDVRRFTDLYTLHHNFRQADQDELRQYYLDQIAKNSGLQLDIDFQEIMAFFVNELPSLEEINKAADWDEVGSLFIETLKEVISLKIMQEYIEANPQATMDDKRSVEFFGNMFAIVSSLKLMREIQQGAKENKMDMVEAILQITSYKTINEFKFRLDQKLIKLWGWEEDIAHNADLIDFLFKEFELVPDYLEYYLSRLKDQLGWEFVMDETNEEINSQFYQADQQKAREIIEHALANASAGESKKAIIEKALEDEQFTWDHVSRHTWWTITYIEERFLQKHSQEYEELKEKYGLERARIMADWMQKMHCNKFVNYLPEGMNQEIEKVSSESLEKLKQHYSCI